MRTSIGMAAAAVMAAIGVACGAADGDPASTTAGVGGAGMGGGTVAEGGASTTTTTTSSSPTTTSASGGGGGAVGDVFCPVTFRFDPSFAVQSPRVAGEWHAFDLASAVDLNQASGGYEATAMLPPGLHGYKLVWDEGGNTGWHLDPAATRRKYVDGVENSAVLVRDCSVPGLEVDTTEVTRTAPGQGAYHAVLDYLPAADASDPDTAGYTATLTKDFVATAVDASAISVAPDGTATVNITGLADGKYTLEVSARTLSGLVGTPKRLVFWVEEEAFDWRDALVYMVMTDRFKNGEPNNDPGPTSGADARGDWQGGDLQGVTAAIEDGTLDDLGIRAIWLTPFNQNPSAAYIAADGQTLVTGYHGYWPTKAREVDDRLGGAQALEDMVAAAHDHGIRILMDYVINHVHEDHEYMQQHPDWFRTGCVCGTDGCGWTSHALECMFRDYMPDIDHTVPEANARFVEDAIWWVDRFDLDGLRVDAVKHVEEIATRNLAAAVREEFEAGGTRYFLMGETAMGWNDCADPCNDENYGTIAKYVGPHGLDGQFDFVLYHGVSYRTFAYGDKGMLHADYWLQHGLSKWPEGSIMTPYIGSHDTPRFVSLADYRGQDGAHDRGIPGNQWSNTAEAPSDGEPYRRMRIGMSWLLMLPGAPLLYYGDEYGQWGGADPNNRIMWKGTTGLTSDEQTTFDHIKKLGQARRDLVALRRGGYTSLGATEDTLVFARNTGSEVAVVALTRNAAGDSITVDMSGEGISGVTLSDAMGGSDVVVGGDGQVTLSIPGSGALVLHP